jgi:hypothetical protein
MGRGVLRFMNQDAPDGTARSVNMGLLERRPLRRALHNWRERHQHPFNFAIHLVGIPLAVAGVVWLFAGPMDQWYWGVGAFVLGYVLQFIGHLVEGNDLGEWAGIKRLLGLPYVAIAPRERGREERENGRREEREKGRMGERENGRR